MRTVTPAMKTETLKLGIIFGGNFGQQRGIYIETGIIIIMASTKITASCSKLFEMSSTSQPVLALIITHSGQYGKISN
jgi:hypothetical protein